LPVDVESLWAQLLGYLEEGLVIPVVGSGLLNVQVTQDADSSYYAYLAERLAQRIGVASDGLPTGGELNEVASRHMANRGQVDELYARLFMLAREQTLPIPEPIMQLASISTLRLFVTTTFASFVERALNEVRCGGRAETEVLSYSLTKIQDLSESFDETSRPVVYHVLGKLSAIPEFALTHEDILEFIHALQSEQLVPHRLYKQVEDSSLLILGCRFNDWLARFFLRGWRRMRLSAGYKHPVFVADREIARDTNLVDFLNSFSRGIKVFPHPGPVEFVAELHERWNAAHSTPLPAVPPVVKPDATNGNNPFVFVSYASEDRSAAHDINEALCRAGVDTFFDKDGLEGGDNWETKLREKIRRCSLFLAVISRNVLTSEPRFFRSEWRLALQVFEQLPAYYSGDVFLLPVAIDSTAPDSSRIPSDFGRVQWVRLTDGVVTSDFVERVKQLHRRSQQEKAGVT
jgi:hypothetical protein